MKFMDSVNSTYGIAVGTAASYGVGYVYGAIFRLSATMAARATSVTIASTLIFKVLANLASGGKDNAPSQYYAWHFIGGSLLATVQVVALRHLNMIGSLGTAFLALGATISALENLHGYCNKS